MNNTGSTNRRRSPEVQPSAPVAGSNANQLVTGAPLPRPDEPTVISQRPVLSLSGSPAGPAVNPSELGRTLVGHRLDHFELLEFVGGGGMGAVFKAMDTRLHRIVALKVLALDPSDEEEKVRRFQNEAQSAARLDHDHIARVYFVGQDCGLHYIVFEFIEGVNLRDLVERKGPLPLDEAISYTLQIAEALSHASSRDVVHRDIKPSNVLITPQGRAKLVDMGLARLHQVEQSQEDLTSSGVTLGTFDYISPEQARDPRLADARSDIYSLGCTLYFILTGQPPFPDGNVLQKLLQHNNDPAPDPSQINPEIPEGVSRLVRRMLAKDPRKRQQTPGDLLAEMLVLVDQLGIPSPGLDAYAWALPKPRRLSLLERQLPWLVPLVALVLIVAALDYWWTTSPDSVPADGLVVAAIPVGGGNGESVLAPISPATPDKTAVAGGDEAVVVPTNNVDRAPGSEPGRDAPGDVASAIEPSLLRSRIADRARHGDESAGRLGVEPSQASLFADLVDSASVTPAGQLPVTEPAMASIGENGMPEIGPLPAEAPRVPGPLIVNPQGDGKREFLTLRAAVASAKNNDVIELRFNGRHEEKPIKLNNLKITVRAGDQCRPVLTFRPRELEGANPLQAMFTVVGGQLTLVNLAVELTIPSPRDVPAESWAMFQTQRPELLRLVGCSLTIDNLLAQRFANHGKTAFFDVKSPPGSGLVSMDPSAAPESPVSIQLKNCVARGEATFLRHGDLQPLNLEWDNGLLITPERFLSVTGGETTPKHDGEVHLQLRHVTAAVRGGLAMISNQADARQLLDTEVQLYDSIVQSSVEAPLIEQTGVNTVSEFETQLQWNGNRYFYSGPTTFWRIVGLNSLFGADDRSFAAWQEHWGEERDVSAAWGDVHWRRLPDLLKPAHFQTPADFALDEEAAENPPRRGASDGQDAGAILGDLPALPPPAQE